MSGLITHQSHSGSLKEVVVWRQRAWLKAASLYSSYVYLLTNNLGFAKDVASLVDSTDADAFAKCIVNIFFQNGRTLPLVRELIEDEFNHKRYASDEGSILRGNNIVSKVEGQVVPFSSTSLGKVGANYLKTVLSELVIKLVSDSDLDLEVDPRYRRNSLPALTASHSKIDPKAYTNPSSPGFNSETDDTLEDILAINQYKLRQNANSFLDRISSPDMISQMPREIRAIAGYTSASASAHYPNSVVPLVGGFVMLRFFCPAIVTPESSNLIPADLVLTYRARRNLILLAKLLQNASNGQQFKEEYMSCFDSFVEENRDRIAKYLTAVAMDPEAAAGGPSWAEFNFSGTKDINVKALDMADLFELHRLLYQCSPKLKTMYQARAAGTDSSAKVAKEILDALTNMGPPPKATKSSSSKAKTRETPESEDSSLQTDASPSGGPFVVDTAFLEKARFLYQGPNSKDGVPVFYLIVSRIKLQFFDNVNPLIAHVFKVMEDAVNAGPYILVIDMSWANFTTEMKKNIYKHISNLSIAFSYKYKKNMQAAFIVHPSAYTRAVIYFMRAFTSRKLHRKIHEIYNWKQLTTRIAEEHIALPELSKDFITKSYRVTKINAKGKKQERLIKFTLNSLLNIDPKTRRIQNEKLLSEIEQISTITSSNEIQMKFSEPLEGSKPRKKFFGGQSQLDQEFRRYVCNNTTERDSIIEDVFIAGFQADAMASSLLPQEYTVTKVNQAGKHQERIFKLTVDSLLNLDNNRIRSETSYSGIEELTMDKSDPDVVWMKYKAEPFRRKVICKHFANHLYDALTQGMRNYQQEDDRVGGDLITVVNEFVSEETQAGHNLQARSKP